MTSVVERLTRAARGAVWLGAAALAGCSGDRLEYDFPENQYSERLPPRYSNEPGAGSIFGGGGINILGDDEPDGRARGGGGVGVNAFLWRASLDTLSFMPVASADPFGGVIITDWYTPPESPEDRFKMNVYILGRQLRADGVRVAVFRQSRDGGGWVDSSVEPRTATNIENQILTRARQLRVAAATAN